MIAKGTNSTEGIYNGITEIEKVYKGTSLRYKNWVTKQGVPPLTLNKCRNANIKDYQIYGNSVQEGLPEGYTQLKYIEATGEQYIDTGIVPDANTQVDYKVRFRQGATNASPLMGARVGSNNNNRFFPIAYNIPNTQFRTAFGLTTGTYSTINFNIDYEGSFQPQNEVSIINGTSYSLSGHGFTKDENYNMYLFATLGYGNNLYQAKGRMYYCRIYQDNILVKNLVPCKNSNNEIGMFDLVDRVFHSNIGTGTFTAGATITPPNIPSATIPIEIQSVGDLVTDSQDEHYGKYKIPITVNPNYELPKGYTLLDYIEGTGTQYINTGIRATNNTGMSIKYRYTADGPAGVSGIFKSAKPRQDVFFISTQTGTLPGQAFVAHNGYTSQTSLSNVVLNTDYTMKINYNNDGKIYYNDDYVGDVGTLGLYNSTIPLFARYSVGGKNYSVSNSRIYYVEFTEGTTISHKFIPCINDNNEVGMYDVIGKAFYRNVGTGIFTVGNSLTTTTNIYLDEPLRKIGNTNPVVLPDGYTQLEYIESNGTQYIDTDFVPTANTKISVDFKSNKVSGESFTSVFGVQKDTLKGRCYCLFGSTNNIQITIPSSRRNHAGLNNDETFIINGTGDFFTNNRTEYVIDISSKTVQIENKIWDLSSYHTDFVSPKYNLFLLTRNNAGVADTNCSKGFLYGVKIFEGETLIKKLIPAKNSSGTIGMYDTVNDTFYTNQGTGTFNAGPVIYADYIDFENQKVYINVEVIDDTGTLPIEQSLRGLATPTEESIELPDILLNKGTNVVDVETSLTSSNMWIKYKGKE